jgi:two-component system response regulator DesR
MGTAAKTPALQVLVVDDNEAGRLGVAAVLWRAPGIGRCLAAAGSEAALLAARHRPDVAVLDAAVRSSSPPVLAAALREAAPGLRLVLSSRCGAVAPELIAACGAVAALPPDASAEAAATAVLAAASTPSPAAASVPHPGGTLDGQLSAREREVLGWLARGMTNREIAAQIHLSPDAVKKHASAIFRKLGVRNRTEAARLAAQA